MKVFNDLKTYGVASPCALTVSVLGAAAGAPGRVDDAAAVGVAPGEEQPLSQLAPNSAVIDVQSTARRRRAMVKASRLSLLHHAVAQQRAEFLF